MNEPIKSSLEHRRGSRERTPSCQNFGEEILPVGENIVIAILNFSQDSHYGKFVFVLGVGKWPTAFSSPRRKHASFLVIFSQSSDTKQ
jgi:hypothetical protein